MLKIINLEFFDAKFVEVSIFNAKVTKLLIFNADVRCTSATVNIQLKTEVKNSYLLKIESNIKIANIHP
jgi:hypothetical protein